MTEFLPENEDLMPPKENHLVVRSIIVLAALLLMLATPAGAEEFAGRVVGVSDGDTVKVLRETKETVKVRLAEIDTPESGQPYGSRAKQALSDLVYGKPVRVVVQDTDRYGRTVGRVYAGAQDVNAEMIRQGAAWVYRQYSRDPSLLSIEQEARAAKRGLWALPEAQIMPPWEWRAAERTAPGNAAPSRPAASVATGFTCEGKRICGQMGSCAEARFYLNQCGLSRLDGEGRRAVREAVPLRAIPKKLNPGRMLDKRDRGGSGVYTQDIT